jgi:hypothetical protein
MPVSPILLPEDQLVRAALVVRGKYDFAVDGGAISTIAITAGLPIPLGSVVVGGYVDVITPFTSGGAATIACQVEAANDILTAVAVASWTAGRKNILPAPTTGALTASTAVKTTADRNISLVIAAFALTAGVAHVVLYVIPPLSS